MIKLSKLRPAFNNNELEPKRSEFLIEGITFNTFKIVYLELHETIRKHLSMLNFKTFDIIFIKIKYLMCYMISIVILILNCTLLFKSLT